MISVRNARADDIPWLLDQLRAFDQFFGARRSLFPTDERAERVVLGLIAHHVFKVATAWRVPPQTWNDPPRPVELAPIGFIAGALAPHPYNIEIRTLTETFWWVEPAHRGGRAGLLLLDAFLEEGRQRADWITMTLEHNSPVNDRLLEKRGFKHYSRDFLMEVTS